MTETVGKPGSLYIIRRGVCMRGGRILVTGDAPWPCSGGAEEMLLRRNTAYVCIGLPGYIMICIWAARALHAGTLRLGYI